MHNNLKKSYPGVTSLLLVLAIGLVLTVMVAGITAFTIREIQQSSNTELSNRALQTAESGVRLAAQQLASNPAYAVNDCPVSSNSSSIYSNIVNANLNESITCIEVKSTFNGVFEGSAQTDMASQISMGPNTTYATGGQTPRYINLQWHDKTLDGTLANYIINPLYAYYPTINNAKDHAASVELDIVYWKGGDSVSLKNDDIKVANILLNQEHTAPKYSNSSIQLDNKCYPDNTVQYIGNYACGTVAASGNKGFDLPVILGIDPLSFTSYNVILRFKPRYRSTHFIVQAYAANNTTLVPIKSADAIIDVTAKTGNLYRRVKATAPVASSALENVFDSAIYSGRGADDRTNNGICKKIIVKADNSKVSDTCQ